MLYNIDGHIIHEKDAYFPPTSRGYRYGDGFFESMQYSHGRLLHADLHLARMHKSAMLLKMTLPEWLSMEGLEKRIEETALTEHIHHARVRCTVLREGAGLYTPLENRVSIVIEIHGKDTPGYDWNTQGLILGSFKELNKNSNFTSTLKTTSALVQVMAAIYARENKLDECLVYNDSGRVAEGIGSNIFLVNGEFLVTPPLSEYCVDGVMRRVVINLAQAYGYTVLEQPITDVSVNSADEVFFTSATRGIRWVGNYHEKHYKHFVSKVLYDKLSSAIGI